jgi:glycosyltransferase involved in cell wall biosynthesis
VSRPFSQAVVAEVEIPPPARLAVGKGSAFVIGGYCYHPDARTRMLQFDVDGTRHNVERFRLPRQDVYARVGANGRTGTNAFRSGFVAMPTIAPVESAREAEVKLVLTVAGGREESVRVAGLRLEPSLSPPREPPVPEFPGDLGPRVAICMATYNPPGELLRRQLDSIREQTHGNWICLISDDCSEPSSLEALAKEIEGDPRFVLAPNDGHLGFYGNFERALAMAPSSADFVTLCDQDDRWRPEKLERLLEGIGGAQLVYSDARVVGPDGALIHGSYWSERRNNYTNFGSLLLANSVTGAASLFPRELLDDVLPFPPALAQPFHDHWLAIVALARGEIAYIHEPLYDYVQRADAVIGHATANRRPKPIRRHLMERLRNPGDGSRIAYYYNWYQQLLFAEVLRLRCWQRMAPAKRRTLGRLLSADDGVVGLAWLLGRRARRLLGKDETLDRELLYAYALLRRRAVSLYTLGRRRPGRWLSRDASIPPMPTREDSP